MILNNTPVRTSINYGINNFEIPEEVLNISINNFNSFKFKNVENCEIVDNNFNLSQPINNKLSKLKTNFSKKIFLNKSTKKPISIDFNLNKNKTLVEKLFLEVAKNVNANLIIKYSSSNNVFHSGQIKIKLCENSNLNIVVINFLQNDSVNIINCENLVLKNSNLNFKIIDFGCKYSVWSNNTQLNGTNAKSNLQTIYLGSNNNKLDFNFAQNILKERCLALINCVGALFHESTKNFKGTINFNKGCKKSVGDENEFCMLLSNKAKSKALPILLCNEEDITGNHSTAVGKIDNKQLFYLLSRGLSRVEAIKIMVKAKFSSILNDLFDNKLKQEILNKIDERVQNEK